MPVLQNLPLLCAPLNHAAHLQRALAGGIVADESPAPPDFPLSQVLHTEACATTLSLKYLKLWHNSHGLVAPWNRATWCYLCSHQQGTSEITLECTPLRRKRTALDFNLEPRYWRQKQYYLSTRSNVCCMSIYAAYINLSCSEVLLMLQAFLTICMSLFKKKKKSKPWIC